MVYLLTPFCDTVYHLWMFLPVLLYEILRFDIRDYTVITNILDCVSVMDNEKYASLDEKLYGNIRKFRLLLCMSISL